MDYVEEIAAGLGQADSRHFADSRITQCEDEVCVEETVQIHLNGEPLVQLVASPLMLAELGAGFVITEGLATAVDEVRVDGCTVRVTAPRVVMARPDVTESGGGMSTARVVGRVDSGLEVTSGDIFAVIAGIVSDLWARTGGAHCSILYADGAIVAKASDVGRHNTVDKVVGYAVLNGIDPGGCILGCTGRQPAGMVAKSVNAGIPVVVTKAASTDKGIRTAEEGGLTLVCRVKDGRFRVYTHARRVRGLRPEAMVGPDES